MKYLIGALAIAIVACVTAAAQSSKTQMCGTQNDKVCKISADRHSVSCYNTKFAENFKVCKNENGYFICCETPGPANTTFAYASGQDSYEAPEHARTVNYINTGSNYDPTVPQSQSYVGTPAGSGLR